MKLHRYVDHQRLHIVTKDVISLSISVLLLFRHYISHKITFGAPSSGGVFCSACGAFILSIVSFFKFLSSPYLLEITIMVHDFFFKNKDIHNASLACIINSMPKHLILFCEIWVLTFSFFGMPLRSHCIIFSPRIMQENWLTYSYCSMKKQNYLCDKL